MGDERRFGEHAVRLAARPTRWQAVLHGAAALTREVATTMLLERRGGKYAFRYAACGCGDTVEQANGSVRLGPRGCGHKLCPRCSRKQAAKVAKKVLGHLATAEHGELWSHCLTQRVRPGESLADARTRMRRKWRSYLRTVRLGGMIACMATTHIVWSQRSGGWHYHVHLLLEFPPGVVCPSILVGWWTATDLTERLSNEESSVRRVIEAGPALEGLANDDGDLEFWSEATSEAAKAVQYPLRDMLEGLSAFRLGSDPAVVRHALEELFTTTSGARLRECYGRWRKKPAAAVPMEPEKVPGDEVAPRAVPGAPASCVLGTISILWRRARQGDAESQVIFRALEKTVSNHSDFAGRFVAYCRAAWSHCLLVGASDG